MGVQYKKFGSLPILPVAEVFTMAELYDPVRFQTHGKDYVFGARFSKGNDRIVTAFRVNQSFKIQAIDVITAPTAKPVPLKNHDFSHFTKRAGININLKMLMWIVPELVKSGSGNIREVIQLLFRAKITNPRLMIHYIAEDAKSLGLYHDLPESFKQRLATCPPDQLAPVTDLLTEFLTTHKL